MRCVRLSHRWVSEQWQAVAVVPDEPGDPCQIAVDERATDWLYPGFAVPLYTDEAEGYYLNLTAPEPFAFIRWELVDGRGVPRAVTLSYHEAARLMDGGANVDGVPLPPEWRPALAAFVERHYRPERKKRARPPSFDGAKRDR